MFHQNDSRMRHLIQLYGCYYLSLIDMAYEVGNFPFSAESVNEKLYTDFQKQGWMSETCFVRDPVSMLNHLGVYMKHIVKRPASYRPKKYEMVIGQWKAGDDISHFVRMNRKRCVVFDPWWSEEGGSRAVREGELVSWRVFT